MVWSPGTARLVASRSGWFPAPAQPLAGEEWLQVHEGFVLTVYCHACLVLAYCILS